MVVITTWFYLAPPHFSFLCLNRNSQIRDNSWNDSITAGGFPNGPSRQCGNSLRSCCPCLGSRYTHNKDSSALIRHVPLCWAQFSSHILAKQSRKKEMIPSSRFSWRGIASEIWLPALEFCTTLSCLLTEPSTLGQIPKAGTSGLGGQGLWGRDAAEVTITVLLGGQKAWQEQRDHPPS